MKPEGKAEKKVKKNWFWCDRNTIFLKKIVFLLHKSNKTRSD